MTNIFLCGKVNDDSISDALLPALIRYGGLQYYSINHALKMGDNNLKFLIYDCEKLPNIEFENGIILFKNSFASQQKCLIPENFLCVLEKKNSHAIELLKNTEKAAITCGTSPKDTLSIAGLDELNAVVSLQRNVKTTDNKILEPHDFTVRLYSKLSPSRILAVSAILLLSGQDSSKGFKI